MTKRKYLKNLKKALKGVSAPERDDLVSYYDELIEDALEGGKSAREIFSDLEPAETVAQNYLRERAAEHASDEKQRDHVRKEPPLFARIFYGILAAIASVVLAVLIAAFAATAVGLTVAGVYVLVVSFGLLLGEHAALFFVQWGMAFAVFALAMLSEVVTVALWKALSGMWRLAKGRSARQKPMRKFARRTLIAGCAMLLGGLFVFTAAFGALGFDYKDLAVSEGLAVHEEEIPVSDALTLEADNLAVAVKRSEDETCKLVYRDFPESPKQFAFGEGKAVLSSKGGAFTAFGATFGLQWRRGLLIGVAAGDLQRAELYLPASFSGDLGVHLENGAISIADMVCSDLVATTINGAIELSNVTAETVAAESKNGKVSIADMVCSDLVATTSNGAIELCDVTAETVTAETKNGAIECRDVACTRLLATASTGAITLSSLRADFIFLHTSTGAVKGTIAGREADYAIEAKVSTGSCNLREKREGEKQLEVRVSTGSVHIKFLG